MSEATPQRPRFGAHGRVLHVDLGTRSHSVEEVDESVYRQFLGGYGLGAWLMWKHYPAGADPRTPEAPFAIVSGLLTGVATPFSGRIQIVGKSPLTGTWADSNSGGSVAIQLRKAGYDALVVRGRSERPCLLVVHDDEIRFEEADDLWGRQIPDAFDEVKGRYGQRGDVGVSLIGPAGERGSPIASVMNDRYHAFGRQGFGAIYGSKNLKGLVVVGSGSVPIAKQDEFRAICRSVNQEYRRDLGFFMRLMVWIAQPKRWLGWLYQLFVRLGAKIESPVPAMRQLWRNQGTTSAVSLSVENGDSPVRNWRGAGSVEFPIATKSWKLNGDQVDKLITRRLSCGDCPMPCKGVVKSKRFGLSDVRRPDYETLCGFGANLLNDDLELVVACHDACNRYGMDAVSASATLAWCAEAFEKGLVTSEQLDGHEMRWGNGEAALALTELMGSGRGCGAWLGNGSAAAAAHLDNGSDDFVVAVRGQEPAYHDSRFTSLMGVTYVADPSPGRHTAGSASWNETFGVKLNLSEGTPKSEWDVGWKKDAGKGRSQRHFSNQHQVLNGLGLCMFTNLTGALPMRELTNALTGWDLTDKELLACGERIQNLRQAFNVREGLTPADFPIHRRLKGEGDGCLSEGPLKGITVPLEKLRRDYQEAMDWNPETGRLRASRADKLGLRPLLSDVLDGVQTAPAATEGAGA